VRRETRAIIPAKALSRTAAKKKEIYFMEPSLIQNRIYEIRGQKVMLDFDLAELYQVETKRLKEAVRRNRLKFPEDFMFELIAAEWDNLRSQIASSSWGGRRYLPFAFTEHGITMLASVLNSGQAIRMNIAIVRAFINMKNMVTRQADWEERFENFKRELSERIDEHDSQLSAIYDAIENLLDEKAEQKKWEERKRIGYKS
jgi:ORF6N domain